MPPISPDDPLARLRLLGLLEGATLLVLLLVAMPLKCLAGWPTGVALMGSVHGLVFLLYVHALAAAAGGRRGRHVARAAFACLIPGGTLLNDGWLRGRAA